MLPDKLIQRCQQGDRVALGQLYTLMHDPLLAVCHRYVNDDSTAQDLLHDAFIVILSKINQIKSPQSAEAWMKTVARNIALLHIKQQQQHPSLPIQQLDEAAATTHDATPAAHSTTLPSYDEIISKVNALPEGYQRVFRLSVLEGLSHQQIGAILNIEPHSSSSQLYRAKHLLRQSLQAVVIVCLIALVPFAAYQLLKNKNNSPIAQKTPAPHQPSTSNQQPATVDQQPSTSKRQPSTVDQQPATISQQPATISQQPATVDQQPSPVSARDSSFFAHHSSLKKDPSLENDSSFFTLHSSLKENSSFKKEPSQAWTIDLAYSGMNTPDNQTLPYGSKDMNADIDSTAHHNMPLTLAINVGWQANPRLTLNAGLSYSHLTSHFKEGNTFAYTQRKQQADYLGLSLGANYLLLGNQRLGLYSSTSATLHLPLHTCIDSYDVVENRPTSTINQQPSTLHQQPSWSIGAGLGLRYNATSNVAFFIEPQVRYHFTPSGDIQTWYTAHPLSLSLPVGISITF